MQLCKMIHEFGYENGGIKVTEELFRSVQATEHFGGVDGKEEEMAEVQGLRPKDFENLKISPK